MYGFGAAEGMTLHYHGTPITPNEVLFRLAGKCFCVSYAAPSQVKITHRIGQSVMLDNGAYSMWRTGKATDWSGYYGWVDEWLAFPTTWAVIPDVIDGTEEANDELVREWPFGDRGAPVWHLNESLERLLRLTDQYPRVCFGSSGAFSVVGSPRWHGRVVAAFDALAGRHRRTPWIHMLRGMVMADGPYPFASLDSTNVARNHAGSMTRDSRDAKQMAEAIDGKQCPGRWVGDAMTAQTSFF